MDRIEKLYYGGLEEKDVSQFYEFDMQGSIVFNLALDFYYVQSSPAIPEYLHTICRLQKLNGNSDINYLKFLVIRDMWVSME